MKALEEAHRRGLRTYGMLCPLLPGVSDSPADVGRLVNFVLDCGAEEVFVEPVNGRGPCLGDTEKVIRAAGFRDEADALAAVRHGVGWSAYATGLLRSVQDALKERRSLHKLRFLLYPSKLTEQHATWIRSHSEGVKWLGKN